jgi:hypothetical protein
VGSQPKVSMRRSLEQSSSASRMIPSARRPVTPGAVSLTKTHNAFWGMEASVPCERLYKLESAVGESECETNSNYSDPIVDYEVCKKDCDMVTSIIH